MHHCFDHQTPLLQACLTEKLDAVLRSSALEKQSDAQQFEEAVQRLEGQLVALRDELHDRERQIAELHISNQVRADFDERWIMLVG